MPEIRKLSVIPHTYNPFDEEELTDPEVKAPSPTDEPTEDEPYASFAWNIEREERPAPFADSNRAYFSHRGPLVDRLWALLLTVFFFNALNALSSCGPAATAPAQKDTAVVKQVPETPEEHAGKDRGPLVYPAGAITEGGGTITVTCAQPEVCK